MKLQPKLDSQKVLDKEFPARKQGYDALEVDKFLDIVVDDYYNFEQYINELESKIEEFEKTLKLYKGRMDQMEIKTAVLNEKLSNISNNESASLSNIDLLKRISALEKALDKAGIDPSTIK